MIEVLNKKKKLIGYIEGKKFFNKNKKLMGYLEGNLVKNKNGRILLRLDSHDNIFFGKDQVGFILNSTIWFKEEPIFEFSRQKREVRSKDGKDVLILNGNHCQIEDIDLFGIAIIFLENKWWERVSQLEIQL
ncbi:MAG: hypothetical protein ACFFBE_02905 [Promethearchaeota archaeon]